MTRSILLSFCLFLLCTSCQSQGQEPCPFLEVKKDPYDLCGYVEVPLDYKNPGGEQLRIPYWVIKSKHLESLPDPIIFIHGGPGGKVMELAQFFQQLAFDSKRDFILFDQRGIGITDPFCPGLTDAFLNLFAQNLNPEEETQAIKKALQLCSEDKAIFYTTDANVKDLEALRTHLGINQWNLFGGSYGTRLGLAYMQKFPNQVRSAILNGVFPQEVELFSSYLSNFDRSLNLFFDLCAGDPNCSRLYPNLKAQTFQVIATLKQTPFQFVLNQQDFFLNTQDFLLLLQQMLYNESTAVLIPSLVTAINQENAEETSTITNAILQGLQGVNSGVFYTVMAAEEGYLDHASLQKEQFKAYPQYAPGISFFLSGPDPLDLYPQRSFNPEQLKTDLNIPMLLVSGGLDPITPPHNARYLKNQSPYQYFLDFPQGGHAPINTCFFTVAQHFIDQPQERPNMDCRLTITPLRWP